MTGQGALPFQTTPPVIGPSDRERAARHRDRLLRNLRSTRRRQNAMRLQASSGGGLFGSSSPQLGRWTPGLGDANVPLQEIATVRERSRDAALNSPMYRAIRRTAGDHVIGDVGLVPKSAVSARTLGITDTQAADWNGAVDELFETHKDRADVTGKKDWAGTCRVAFNAVFDGGDTMPSFPVTVRDDERLVRVNLIEAERVETPPKFRSDPRVIHGVRIDEWGAPTGFYVWRTHPGALHTRTRDRRFEFWRRRVDIASGRSRLNVIQLFDQERIGQARGVPFLNSVLDLIDKVPEYVDVTLDAADAQTRLSIWLMTQGDPETVKTALDDTLREEVYNERFGMGVDTVGVNVANAGDDVKILGSSHPSQYTDPFLVRLSRFACAVAGVPYSIAFADTAGTNYSSQRGERLTFQGTIGCFRRTLLPMPQAWRAHLVYDAWLDGKLPPVPFEENPDAWLRATWAGPRIGHVDPAKEMAAFTLAVDRGFMSRDEVIALGGGDRTFLDVANDLKKEKDTAEELGISIGAPVSSGGFSSDRGEIEDDEEVDDDENEDDEEQETEQELEEADA